MEVPFLMITAHKNVRAAHRIRPEVHLGQPPASHSAKQVLSGCLTYKQGTKTAALTCCSWPWRFHPATVACRPFFLHQFDFTRLGAEVSLCCLSSTSWKRSPPPTPSSLGLSTLVFLQCSLQSHTHWSRSGRPSKSSGCWICA